MNRAIFGLKPVTLVLLAMAVFVALHAYRINDPPNGMHEWRESSTGSVTMNFHQEDLRIWLPRVHDRGAGPGIAGAELPLYNYAGALLYKITGPTHVTLHILTMLVACLGMYATYRVVTIVFNPVAGALAAWSFAFSPLVFFYGFKMMPDLLMVALVVCALWLYLRYRQSGGLGRWLGALLLLVCGAAIKPHGLSIILPILWLAVKDENHRSRSIALAIVFGALATLIVRQWFMYAVWLNETYLSDHFAVYLHLAGIPEFVFSGEFFKKLIQQWPVEIWIGWFLMPAWLFGVYKAIRLRLGGAFLFWILGCYGAFLITAHKSCTHDYYTLIAVAPFAAFTGLGLYKLWDSHGWQRKLALLMIVLAPFWAWHRISHRFGDTETFGQVRAAAIENIPADELVIVDDRTPIDMLYQMNRYGWSLRNDVDPKLIREFIGEGGRYLVLTQPVEVYGESVMSLVEDSVTFLGPLYSYRVRDSLTGPGR